MRYCHVEAFLLARRHVVPRHVARDLRLVFDALLVEYAERPHLAGAHTSRFSEGLLTLEAI